MPHHPPRATSVAAAAGCPAAPAAAAPADTPWGSLGGGASTTGPCFPTWASAGAAETRRSRRRVPRAGSRGHKAPLRVMEPVRCLRARTAGRSEVVVRPWRGKWGEGEEAVSHLARPLPILSDELQPVQSATRLQETLHDRPATQDGRVLRCISGPPAAAGGGRDHTPSHPPTQHLSS